MTLPEIMFAIAESNPNCRRFRFETLTRPALTKKNRTTKEPTNFVVEIRSRFTASLGVNYENEVNDIRESQGLARDFESQKPSGKHYVNGTNWLMEADKTPGKFYAALSRFEGRETTYLIDGVPARRALSNGGPIRLTRSSQPFRPDGRRPPSRDRRALAFSTRQ